METFALLVCHWPVLGRVRGASLDFNTLRADRALLTMLGDAVEVVAVFLQQCFGAAQLRFATLLHTLGLS